MTNAALQWGRVFSEEDSESVGCPYESWPLSHTDTILVMHNNMQEEYSKISIRYS